MNKSHLYFFLFCFLLPVLPAQTVRFIAPYGLQEELYLGTEQGWQILSYSNARRGPAYDISGLGAITLGRQGEIDEATGLPTYEVVKAMDIASGMKELICFLVPARNRGNGLQSLIIDDSKDAFRPGEMRFVNALGRIAFFQVDDEYLELKHLQAGVVRLKDAGYHRILLRAASATERDGSPSVLFSQERMVRDDVRYLVVSIVDVDNDIRVLWLMDRP